MMVTDGIQYPILVDTDALIAVANSSLGSWTVICSRDAYL